MNNTRKSAYLALLTTTIIWGFAPPLIKYSLEFTSPISFLFWRFLIACLIFAIPFYLKLKKTEITKSQISQYFWLGLLGTPLTLFLLFWGIQQTTAIDSAVISITTPVLVIFGSIVFLKEKVSKLEKIGIALAIFGTIVTILQPILESQRYLMQNLFGNLLVFLGSITWAAFTILTKKGENQKLDPFILTASSFLVGFLLFIPLKTFDFLNCLQSRCEFLSLPALPGILYMAIFGSVIAYYTYIYGLSKIEASRTTVFTYLQPIFAIPLSLILLKETITIPFLVGAIFIIAGVFASEYKKIP